MQVNLAYGRSGLTVRLPDSARVIKPRFVPGIPDAAGAIRNALRRPMGSPPLAAIVKAGQRVVIAHTDITRRHPQ